MPGLWFDSKWKDLVQGNKTFLICPAPQVQWVTALARVRDMLLSLSADLQRDVMWAW